MGVQDEYEQSNEALKGGKFTIRDFPQEEREAAEAQLEAAGFIKTFGIQGADLIVVKSEASRGTINQAKRGGVTVLNLDQALQLAGLSDVVELGENETRSLPRRSAVEFKEDTVRILDVVIPRRKDTGKAGRAKSPEKFNFLCLDKGFMITARNVAAAAGYDIPCVLEGETATAKTTIIRWVAALAGQPVYRLNLNGQTDTSELVGRYVPASGRQDMEIDVLLDNMGEFDVNEDWARVRKDLEEIKAAREAGEPRDLNPIEKARAAKTLGLASKSWEFIEGFIPKALRYGAWVILDEMNLAEPQILERLNSVLEDGHSLVLTEGEGTVFGSFADESGQFVKNDEHFRLFGTMNPAEYAGRSALSPAFRDRWRLWRFVNRPSQADLHAMLRTQVYGEQPEFEFRGTIYQADPTPPTYPEMQEIDGIDSLLERLAAFHYSISQAAGDSGKAQIGRTRRERYVFTRRGLLTIMKLIHRVVCKGESVGADKVALSVLLEDLLTQGYVERVQDETDRVTILTAMRAAGLIEV